jgi:hypothetical protein
MEKHVTVTGILHIGFGALGVFAAAIVFVVLVVTGAIALMVEGDPEPLPILTIIGSTVAAFLVVLSTPEIVGGIGLLKHKPWARYLVLVLAVFDLFNVPLGTALGAYSIWVLLHDETVRLFASGSEQ